MLRNLQVSGYGGIASSIKVKEVLDPELTIEEQAWVNISLRYGATWFWVRVEGVPFGV